MIFISPHLLCFMEPQESKFPQIINVHDNYTTNLVTSFRMASMDFCKLIITSNKVASMQKEQISYLSMLLCSNQHLMFQSSYSYGVETGRPRSALNSHGVIGPLNIMSASSMTINSASVSTWLSQWSTAAGLLIAGYLWDKINKKWGSKYSVKPGKVKNRGSN